MERRGLDVLLNGILIRRGPDWPQPQYEDVTVDPGDPPPGCTPWDDETGYLERNGVTYLVSTDPTTLPYL